MTRLVAALRTAVRFWFTPGQPWRTPKPPEVRFPRCIVCGSLTYVPKGRGEVVSRWSELFVRQSHDCAGCGTRYLFHRSSKNLTWFHDQLSIRSY